MTTKKDSNIGKVIPLDSLVERCGYFVDNRERAYGCDHPDQEEKDDNSKGKCFGFSCPLAVELNPETEPKDRKEFGKDWKSMSDGYWMKVHSKYKPNKG